MKNTLYKRTISFVSHFDFNLFRFRLPIMRELVLRGTVVYAVCPEGKYAHKFMDYGIQHVPWNCIRDNKNLLYELKMIIELAKIFKKYKPDIIHAFTIRPNLYGSYANYLCGAGAHMVNSVTGLGSIYINNGERESSYKERLANLAYKLAFLRSEAVIFQNPDDRKYLIDCKVVKVCKAFLIRGSGVDTSKFTDNVDRKAIKAGIYGDTNRIVILFVGRLIREKGILHFYEAAKILTSTYGDKVKFIAVGGIDKGNLSHIQQSVYTEMRQSGYVDFAGRREDVEKFYSFSDIFCLPSYREGIPNTTLEAMASGLPIVTTDVPGCRETVDEGINGFKVPPRNVDQLVDRLERLIVDPDLRERMGRASRKKAEQEFSVDKVVEQHIELYQKILCNE